jgi:uncharacterized protein YukE
MDSTHTTETPAQTQAWDQALADSADVLDQVAAEVEQEATEVPLDADDTTW